MKWRDSARHMTVSSCRECASQVFKKKKEKKKIELGIDSVPSAPTI